MAIDDDLDLIERSMRQLQIEWEKFFSGVEKRPPSELKARLEGLIRRYDPGDIRNNAARFRYQTLQARYNTFSELWSKRLRAVEEGRPIAGYVPRTTAPSEAEPVPQAPPRTPGEYRVRDPGAGDETVRGLYQRFLEARKQTGEAVNVKFDNFQKLIAQQASRILSEKGAQAVDFRLETKDGKVSLKAKAVK